MNREWTSSKTLPIRSMKDQKLILLEEKSSIGRTRYKNGMQHNNIFCLSLFLKWKVVTILEQIFLTYFAFNYIYDQKKNDNNYKSNIYIKKGHEKRSSVEHSKKLVTQQLSILTSFLFTNVLLSSC